MLRCSCLPISRNINKSLFVSVLRGRGKSFKLWPTCNKHKSHHKLKIKSWALWSDRITGTRMLETVTVIWGAKWRRDTHTHWKPSVIKCTPFLLLCLFILCSLPFFQPRMPCQKMLFGNTVSNLTNGSLKYCFERKKDHTEQTERKT